MNEQRPFTTSDAGAFGHSRVSVAARGSVVNRTHRVVRQRAGLLAARRSHVRSLWIPLAVFSALLLIICTAVWDLLSYYDVTSSGVPNPGNQFLVLLLWFFPVSMTLLAMVLFRRARKRTDGEVAQ
jgi:hypothetical protein